jgi:U1 small nuclear ribonucleoprotein C
MLTAIGIEIGHEKAQSVIDSITNSYAAEGQAGQNPMFQAGAFGPMGGPGAFPPPPMGFQGEWILFPCSSPSSTSLVPAPG